MGIDWQRQQFAFTEISGRDRDLTSATFNLQNTHGLVYLSTLENTHGMVYFLFKSMLPFLNVYHFSKKPSKKLYLELFFYDIFCTIELI